VIFVLAKVDDGFLSNVFVAESMPELGREVSRYYDELAGVPKLDGSHLLQEQYRDALLEMLRAGAPLRAGRTDLRNIPPVYEYWSLVVK
jgi:hypothetical protein